MTPVFHPAAEQELAAAMLIASVGVVSPRPTVSVALSRSVCDRMSHVGERPQRMCGPHRYRHHPSLEAYRSTSDIMFWP